MEKKKARRLYWLTGGLGTACYWLSIFALVMSGLTFVSGVFRSVYLLASVSVIGLGAVLQYLLDTAIVTVFGLVCWVMLVMFVSVLMDLHWVLGCELGGEYEVKADRLFSKYSKCINWSDRLFSLLIPRK